MSEDTPKRILVIDDEEEVREMVRVVLARAGYTVETSGSPSDIVASLLVGRYDLVTVDLKMPEMDGEDIAELSHTLNQRIPIVVISGFLTPDLCDRLKGIGVHYFVEKPFKPEDLVNTVRDALNGTTQASSA